MTEERPTTRKGRKEFDEARRQKRETELDMKLHRIEQYDFDDPRPTDEEIAVKLSEEFGKKISVENVRILRHRYLAPKIVREKFETKKRVASASKRHEKQLDEIIKNTLFSGMKWKDYKKNKADIIAIYGKREYFRYMIYDRLAEYMDTSTIKVDFELLE